MKFLLATLLAACAFGSHPEVMSWSAWKSAFGKSYKTTALHNKARDKFNANVREIAAHNAQADAGKQTFRLGVNQFSDLTQKEWSDKYLSTHKHFEKNYVDLSDVVADASVDWRAKGAVTPVKNQGQCGSCWSFSTTGSIEGANQIKNGKLVSLSEQQLMDCSGAYGDHSCEGGLMDNAFKYVIHNGGIDTESDYPYKMRDESCEKAKEATHAVSITGYHDVDANEDSMVKAVTINPVSIAIEADQSSFQHYRSGTFNGPCGTRLDHGVLTVGYTADYFIVKNSWGETWGDSGYIMMGRASGGSSGMCGMYLSASYPVAGVPGPTAPPTTPGPTPPGPDFPDYENPYKGSCHSDEQAIQIQGIAGAFCAPKCQGFLRKCPAAPSAVSGANAECALQDTSGDKFCALICTPGGGGCDAAINMTCKDAGQGGIGLCTYNQSTVDEIQTVTLGARKAKKHKVVKKIN